MGAFLTSLHVRKASQQAVCDAFQKMNKGRAYVSPASGNWVTIYSEITEDQNDQTLRDIASRLSRTLKTDVLAFLVHDSDITAYWLYRIGELLDEFNSAPDYFEEKEFGESEGGQGGDPEVLLPLCVPGTTREQLQQVLHPSDGYPIMAEEIVYELAKLLGIDETRSSLGFNYFESEGEQILSDIAKFQPIGKSTERKQSRVQDTKVIWGALPDMYPLAINMLAHIWKPEYEQQIQMLAKMFGKGKEEQMVKQMREGFDRSARDFLKKSELPNLPTIEELKAARDQGPEALAALVAKKTPAQMTDIGIAAANGGIESFLAALFKHGLEPNVPDSRGLTILQIAEKHGLNSSIYRLAKAAAEKKQ